MLVQPIQIVQNDYGYQLPFTLEDALGNAVNLTGATLSLAVQSAQDPSGTLITLSGTIGIDNATEGTCHYTVAISDFTNPGTYLAQISAAYGSETISWAGFQIVVLPALPKTIN
jgi:BppU N-terminal domain